jgi:putative DNA primase/helicase
MSASTISLNVVNAARLIQKGDEKNASALLIATEGWSDKQTKRFIEDVKRQSNMTTTAPVAVPALLVDDTTFHDYTNYLTAIFRPGDTLCFVGIEHNKDKGKERIENDFVSFETATSREYFDELSRSNQHGSIYVAMNTFPSQLVGQKTGRTQENVVDVRAVQADVDYNGEATMSAIKASTSVPQPSIVVESSPGKFQGIWLVDGISKADAKPLMQGIAATFNTDSAVAEIARVMRVPGFVNRKYETAPVARTLTQSNIRYTRESFKVSMPSTSIESKNPENWVKDIQLQHGQIYNQLVKLAGYYVREHNADDSEVLYTLLARHCETAVDRDGVTPFQCDMEQVSQYAEKWSKEFETGEAYKARTQLTMSSTQAQTATVPQQLQQSEVSQPQEWGEVIPLDNILRPVLPFRETFLPKIIRGYCADVVHRMSVPMDFAGIAALETLFGVVGRRAFVYPKAQDKTWTESLTMSGGVVASSGAIKSPTWKLFTNALVEQEADWGRKYKQDFAQYEEAVTKWKDAVGKEKKTKEANIADLIEPQTPTASRRLILNDSTPEKAHSMMAENPSGLFYYRDELSAWVDELDKEGRETQRGLFLQAMNGDDAYTMDRIGRGSITATMSLSVAGNFQPDLLRRFLADDRNTQDGMMARFTLMVWPDSVKRGVIDRRADVEGKTTFRNIVRALAGLKPESMRFHFDKNAQSVFLDWLQWLYEKIDQESHPGKQAHLSKWAGALPKFAALCQLVDLVAMGGKFEGDFQIDEEHLQMALDFFQYLESHMNRVYDAAYSSTEIAELTLVERIQNGTLPDGKTAREIRNNHWAGRGYKGTELSVDSVTFALENLAEKNWVRPVVVMPGPMGGRPSTRWEINPKARVAK